MRRVVRTGLPPIGAYLRRRPSPRTIGGLVSHVGVGLLALAVVASATGKRETSVSLRTGESAEVLGQTLTFLGSVERPGPNRTVISARVVVGNGGTELDPALNVFPTSTQAIASPAIVPGPVDDLYVTLLDLDPAAGVATLRIGVHPFVSWIWPAGGLVALGGMLALGPLPIRRRAADARASRVEAATVGAEARLDAVGR